MSPRPSHVVPVSLDRVCKVLGLPMGGTGVALTGVTHASGEVQPGDLFAALPGLRLDGADFAHQAVQAGAAAVLAARPLELEVPVLVVDDPRAVLGEVAAEIYGRPSTKLLMVGITGTNGKTTTAHLVDAGLRAAGHTTALLGTIGVIIAGEPVGGVRTTPESTDLQAMLALAVERGVTAAIMEVSSHALALHRVAGCRFQVAVFTNLSQDHLDFHGTMADYFAVKSRLFTAEMAEVAVIDVTDAWGARLAGSVHDVPVRRIDVADEVPTRLLGAFNRRNAALAVATLEELGAAAGRDAVSQMSGVPGRMESVDAGQDFLALVDYAHTPDAVAALLAAVRPLAAPAGRVTIVLGCGGDRDRSKRPLMGGAAVEGADRVIFTDDNPRSEASEAILGAMLEGVPDPHRERVLVCPDRAAAIDLAVGPARHGDVVVIAGRGHEPDQERGGVLTPFDDRDVLRKALQRRDHS